VLRAQRQPVGTTVPNDNASYSDRSTRGPKCFLALISNSTIKLSQGLSNSVQQEFLRPPTELWLVRQADPARELQFRPRVRIHRRLHRTYESASSVLERFRRATKPQSRRSFFSQRQSMTSLPKLESTTSISQQPGQLGESDSTGSLRVIRVIPGPSNLTRDPAPSTC